jgi:tetratricopeptide (TPR) repeat protein
VGALLVARRLAPLWPFAAASAATLLLCTVFFTNARFRLPLAPLLILLAGAGCAEACNRLGSHAWRDLPGRTVLSALFVGAVAAWLTFSDPYGVRTYKNPALIANAGVAERLAGHPQRAQAYLLEAVTLDPTDELAWVHLALAREETGNAPAALEALLTARRHLGRSADLENTAQSFFARHGLAWERWQAYGAAAPAAQAVIARELLAQLALPPRREQGGAGGDPVDSRRQKP